MVGGGILGLAHAWVLARGGRRVALFERGQRATGASIRNFGMIWPIGQPAGEMHRCALRSRELWLEMLRTTGLPSLPTGSLHVAHAPDEADVLREFAEIGPAAGYPCRWLTAAEALRRSPAIEPANFHGALWSETELTVDPRCIVAELPACLARMGVDCHYGIAVRAIELPRIETTAGVWEVDEAVVCGGDDFQSLYPEIFSASGLTRCKLQMMRTRPQPQAWQLGPALAAGLTLRFYKNVGLCSSLEKLKRRIASEKPEYERFAIHVLASQTADGAITLGDSHEYGDTVDIFDKDHIDQLILSEARTFLRLPDCRIAERWQGVYALHPDKPYFAATPAPGVRIVTAPGGSGMTLSFGLADQTCHETNS